MMAKIRHGCASVKQSLDLFQDLCLGKTEETHELCDDIQSCNQANGADMSAVRFPAQRRHRPHQPEHMVRTQIAPDSSLQGSGDFKLPKVKPRRPAGAVGL